jgi:hypothetical protein
MGYYTDYKVDATGFKNLDDSEYFEFQFNKIMNLH